MRCHHAQHSCQLTYSYTKSKRFPDDRLHTAAAPTAHLPRRACKACQSSMSGPSLSACFTVLLTAAIRPSSPQLAQPLPSPAVKTPKSKPPAALPVNITAKQLPPKPFTRPQAAASPSVLPPVSPPVLSPPGSLLPAQIPGTISRAALPPQQQQYGEPPAAAAAPPPASSLGMSNLQLVFRGMQGRPCKHNTGFRQHEAFAGRCWRLVVPILQQTVLPGLSVYSCTALGVAA